MSETCPILSRNTRGWMVPACLGRTGPSGADDNRWWSYCSCERKPYVIIAFSINWTQHLAWSAAETQCVIKIYYINTLNIRPHFIPQWTAYFAPKLTFAVMEIHLFTHFSSIYEQYYNIVFFLKLTKKRFKTNSWDAGVTNFITPHHFDKYSCSQHHAFLMWVV